MNNRLDKLLKEKHKAGNFHIPAKDSSWQEINNLVEFASATIILTVTGEKDVLTGTIGVCYVIYITPFGYRTERLENYNPYSQKRTLVYPDEPYMLCATPGTEGYAGTDFIRACQEAGITDLAEINRLKA